MFFLLRECLANFGTWYLILLGALSIAIVLVMPQGLWGLWRKKFSVGLLPIGHTAVEDDPKRACRLVSSRNAFDDLGA